MMSNLGKRPIYIDKEVDLFYRTPCLLLEGKQGQIELKIPETIHCESRPPFLLLKPRHTKEVAEWGTIHAKIRRALIGVRAGFRTQLRLVGVGYRARIEENSLVLKLGFSHLVTLPIPATLAVECPKTTLISIGGADWEEVYGFAARVRGTKPPEPYKGKGLFYRSETIRRKEGKKS